MRGAVFEAADDVMRAGQLAAALEVCGWPKPGNVHRTADFRDTRFEHFIAGSVALGPALRRAAVRGIRVGLGRLPLSGVEVGRWVKQAVEDVGKWHGGGNTHLGISLLFIPLAAAAGLTCASSARVEAGLLRRNVERVMASTTAKDAVLVYAAIAMASSEALGRFAGGRVPDVTDREAAAKIVEREITLRDAMAESSAWDNVARELVTGMQVSFEVGYPAIVNLLAKGFDMNVATVHAFLTILSRLPDTFIARKVGAALEEDISKAVELGLDKAREVSRRAARVLELGGLSTEEGRAALWRFDEELRSQGNELNPGTTADLTASSLMVAILCGARP